MSATDREASIVHTLSSLRPEDLFTISDVDASRLLMLALPDLNVIDITALMNAGKAIGPSWRTAVELRRNAGATTHCWSARVDTVWKNMNTREFLSNNPHCALHRALLDAWLMVERYEDGWTYEDDEGYERSTAP